ncbi:MAG: TVP38/TMEM64 family protein [Dehalococcoidia bacterium]|nr:TVP38/TMEM64 family protein [Dehalococcoidia bacterium]
MTNTEAVQEKKHGHKRRNLLILFGAVIMLALLWLLWPGFRSGVRQVLDILARADIERLRQYLRSFGVWAPIVSALIMILQAVLFPLPAFIVTVTNGLVFGAFWGTLLSWSSAMVGAAVCWAIGKALGRPAVEKMVSKKALGFADRFFERYGNNSVLIARLVPVVSFDVVSYVAGVTSISFLGFFIATGIGQLPATIIYSVLGQNLPKAASLGLYAFGALAALLVLGFTLKKVFERRVDKKRRRGQLEEGKSKDS